MRYFTFCSSFITVGIFFFHFSSAAQRGDPTSVPIRIIDGMPVIEVTLNGKGPYDFLLDTGSNYSTVQSRILSQLTIPLGDKVVIDTATDGRIDGHKTILESLSVGGLSVSQVIINTIEPRLFSQSHRHLAGTLGENFLEHFDILLDNEKKTLVLDRTSRLSESLAGEQIPFSRFGIMDGGRTFHRIVIELKIPRYVEQSLRCLVDSGASFPLLFPEVSQAQRLQTIASPSAMVTLSGDGCIVAATPLVIGGITLHGTEVFSCRNMRREAADTDCLLPTHLFKRILISHASSYIIVNPTDSRKSQEVANAVLLPR